MVETGTIVLHTHWFRISSYQDGYNTNVLCGVWGQPGFNCYQMWKEFKNRWHISHVMAVYCTFLLLCPWMMALNRGLINKYFNALPIFFTHKNI